LSHIADHQDAYTTAIVVACLDEAGCIRVNLQADTWRSPADRRAFLDRWAAPVLLGDPLALAALEQVGIEHHPQAMLSCIMSLSDALAETLSARYGCPVLDLYALTEAGIVAVRTPQGHRILPHDLYVEILDEHDEPCPPGIRGEVVLTGGRNPFCPLLRYRTGDFAALEWHDGHPVLTDLEGREPVVFRTVDRELVHGMDVSRALRRFPLVQFQLTQRTPREFKFAYRGSVNEEELQTALMDLLGRSAQVEFGMLPPPGPARIKVRQYFSALD
jgi:phenylacetate-CoA ligase